MVFLLAPKGDREAFEELPPLDSSALFFGFSNYPSVQGPILVSDDVIAIQIWPTVSKIDNELT